MELKQETLDEVARSTGQGRYLQQIISLLAQGLKERRCEVYLFGSRASGEHSEASDFDIIVFSPDDVTRELSLIRERLEMSNIPFLVDLVDGSRTSPEFSTQAREKGRLLWSN